MAKAKLNTNKLSAWGQTFIGKSMTAPLGEVGIVESFQIGVKGTGVNFMLNNGLTVYRKPTKVQAKEMA